MLTIGEAARRAGVATSALRFYEAEGLIHAHRTSGNQRRYEKSTLRRIAVIRASQAVGLPLSVAKKLMDALPPERAPDARDWEKASAIWRDDLDERIDRLMRLRDQLTSCIGCGCLSLQRCALFNPGDEMVKTLGSGSKLTEGDPPE